MATWNSSEWNAAAASTAAGVSIGDLLRSSFRCIGQLRPGFGYSPSELIDALFVLNAMLDSWVTDELNCYCTLTQNFTLVASQASYTMGPGGDFDTVRPVRLTIAKYIVLDNPAQPLHLDVINLNAEQYESIALPDLESPIPQRIYFNPTYPLATVKLWPVPSNADQVRLSSAQPISGGITSEAALFSVPPGYLDAVRYQLAIRLAMEWDKPLKEGVLALATEALAKVQRLNAPSPQMQVNGGVFPARGGQSGFNIYTGDFD